MTLLWEALLAGLCLRITMATPAFAPEAPLPTATGIVFPRNFQQGQNIDAAHYASFTTEYAAATSIASIVQPMISASNYYYQMFIPKNYQDPSQAQDYQNFLGKFISLGGDPNYVVTVDYKGNANDQTCQQRANTGESYAYTTGKTITLCDPWFAQPPTSQMKCESDKVLDEYETGAMTILHEFTHLDPPYFEVSTEDPPFQDFGYGSAECRALAQDAEDEAIANADTWMYVTLGNYWSNKCGYKILPDNPTTGVYDLPGQTPGCLPGASDQFLVNSGATCNGYVASGSPTTSWYGPEGCGVPNAGGNNGVNVPDCWLFPDGATAAEITLAVTNATQVSLQLSLALSAFLVLLFPFLHVFLHLAPLPHFTLPLSNPFSIRVLIIIDRASTPTTT